MPKSVGMTGSKWFICDLSGFEYPVEERVYQDGMQVAQRFADEPGRESTAYDDRISFAAEKANIFQSWPK